MQKKIHNNNSSGLRTSYFGLQRGVSIYFAFMIMTVLLAAALGMSALLVSQIKTIRGMGDSVVAFYAADTGIEKILYDASTGTNIIIVCPESTPTPCTGVLGEASYRVFVRGPGSNCDGENYCVISTGIFRGTRRAIQVTR